MYPDKSIYTIEDPPEYPIFGAKQLYVLNANTDDMRESKFAEGLRVAMRSDPDILMVGEIRDAATANVAIDAVITGHQMWTTIHAIDVFAIISRLLRFGINKDDLLDEKLLNVLVGQRLLPRLCDCCKIDFTLGNLDNDLFKFLSTVDNGNIRLANPAGCEKCNYTGISGRVVAAEVLEVTSELIEDIKNLGLQAVRREFNATGMTIMKHALSRILNGEVDIRDVIATCGDITKEANIYV
jgi:type II secretory ATPase GspE/PulE/Tfp pilus assembly ATPase PilB-like protein